MNENLHPSDLLISTLSHLGLLFVETARDTDALTLQIPLTQVRDVLGADWVRMRKQEPAVEVLAEEGEAVVITIAYTRLANGECLAEADDFLLVDRRDDSTSGGPNHVTPEELAACAVTGLLSILGRWITVDVERWDATRVVRRVYPSLEITHLPSRPRKEPVEWTCSLTPREAARAFPSCAHLRTLEREGSFEELEIVRTADAVHVREWHAGDELVEWSRAAVAENLADRLIAMNDLVGDVAYELSADPVHRADAA